MNSLTNKTLIFLLLLMTIGSYSQTLDTSAVNFDLYVSQIKVDTLINYENFKGDTINHGYAAIMISNKRYDEAIHLLEKEVLENSNNAYAIHLIGYAYNESGSSERSLIYFNKAIEMIPNQYTFHYNRGLAYKRLNQNQKAIEDYSETIRINPKDNLVYYNRALAYEGIKNFEAAIEDYSLDILINGGKARTYNNRGRCYMISMLYELALNDFNKALELEPTKANAFGNRGILYIKMQQPEKACPDLYQATALGYDQQNLIDKYCK